MGSEQTTESLGLPELQLLLAFLGCDVRTSEAYCQTLEAYLSLLRLLSNFSRRWLTFDVGISSDGSFCTYEQQVHSSEGGKPKCGVRDIKTQDHSHAYADDQRIHVRSTHLPMS